MEKGNIAWIVGVVVVIAAIAGYFLWMSPTPPAAPAEQAATEPETEQAPENTAPEQPVISAETSTDAALDQDMAKIDAELKAVDKDTASVDSSMSDKQVPQEY